MSKSDNSLYVRSDSESLIVIIVYVDDLVIGGERLVDINKVFMVGGWSQDRLHPPPKGFECERREGEMHKEWEKGRIKTHTVEGLTS